MAADPAPTITVVIVTYRRTALLRRCLDSLDAPPRSVEVLLIVNGPGQGEDALAGEAAARWPWLRILVIAQAPRGAARNRAVGEARGRYLHFLDDDTFVPPGFLERLLETLERHPEAPCLGGPNLSPRGAASFQRAVDFLLRSPLGAGPMRVRYLSDGVERAAPGWSLMLCNLGVRREIFEKKNLSFPDRCASAEENLLLSRIEREAGAAVYCPSLHVYHERRTTFAGFCRQVFLSGQGRAQITRLDARSFHPAASAPLAFFLYIASLAWLASRWPVALIPAAAYAGACAAETLRMAFVERDPAGAMRLPALFVLGHACYAAGTAAGIAEPFFRRGKSPA